MTEQENKADDGQWWQIIADWAEDIMQQQIPGSVVILIVLVALSAPIFKLITGWLDRRSELRRRMNGGK